jgi:hypothetical protein
MFASEVVRGFPKLRLVILQLPHRASSSRFEHDRVEASRARRLAGQLFEAGIPAVVVLPSMIEAVGNVILKRIVEAVVSCPKNAQGALANAVFEAQKEAMAALSRELTLADAQSKAAVQLGLDETPFDFCLYCTLNLSLALNPGERK